MQLSIILEEAKCNMISAYNQVQKEANLPAYLMEGIVLDILSQIRNQKNLELVSDIQRMNQSGQEKQEEGE